jgi:hypothetical protein
MRPNPFRNYFKGLSARRGVAPGPQRSAMRSTGEGEFVCWLAFSPGFSIGKRPRCTCKMWSYLLDLLQLLVLDKGTDSPSQSQSRQATQQRQHANMQDVPSGGHRSEATSAFTGWPFCLACSVRPRHWPKSYHRSRCHAVPCPAAERATFTHHARRCLLSHEHAFWCPCTYRVLPPAVERRHRWRFRLFTCPPRVQSNEFREV